MSYRSSILGALTGSAPVTTLCPAEKIYFGTAPRNVIPPFILCSKVSSQPANTCDQGQAKQSRLDNIQLQVTSYARTESESYLLDAAIRKALEAITAPRCMLKDSREAYDDFPDLFGQISTFSTWHSEPI